MDTSFNPFANAWDDDPPTTSSSKEHASGSSTSHEDRDSNTPSWSAPSTDIHSSEAALPSWEPASSGPTRATDDDADTDAGWGAPIGTSSYVGGGQLQEADTLSQPASPTRVSGWGASNVSPPASGAGQGEADEQDSPHAPEDPEHDGDDFGAFGSTDLDYKLPSATAGDAVSHPDRPTADDGDGGDWGTTALPPSKWEESLNAKPTWDTPADKETGWAPEAEIDFTPASTQEEEDGDGDGEERRQSEEAYSSR